MRQTSAPRAYAAWALAGLSATAALTLAPMSWHWVLLGGILAGLYYYIVYRLTDEPLARAMTIAYGKIGGNLVLLLTMLWSIYAAGAAAAGADMAYPEDRMSILAPTCMLLLAAFGGFSGAQTLARASAALALILGLIYAAVSLAALKQVELSRLAPWGSGAQAALAFASLLSASAVFYLPKPEGKLKRPGLLLAFGALPAVLAAVTAGCLSPALAARVPAPFYHMSKSLRILGILERMEPLVSAAMLAGFFCLTSLLTQSAAQIGATMCPQLHAKWWTLIVCALSFAAIWLVRATPQTVQTVLAGIFWGIFPLLTQCIVAVKKVRKKSKKRLDKRI